MDVGVLNLGGGRSVAGLVGELGLEGLAWLDLVQFYQVAVADFVRIPHRTNLLNPDGLFVHAMIIDSIRRAARNLRDTGSGILGAPVGHLSQGAVV